MFVKQLRVLQGRPVSCRAVSSTIEILRKTIIQESLQDPPDGIGITNKIPLDKRFKTWTEELKGLWYRIFGKTGDVERLNILLNKI